MSGGPRQLRRENGMTYTPIAQPVAPSREAVARLLSDHLFANANAKDVTDCGLWEEMSDYARNTYLRAADAVLSLTPDAAKSDAVEALEAMVRQLGKAADQFAYYADEHAKKRTKDGDAKGATNHQWALACAKAQGLGLAALATPTAPSDQA